MIEVTADMPSPAMLFLRPKNYYARNYAHYAPKYARYAPIMLIMLQLCSLCSNYALFYLLTRIKFKHIFFAYFHYILVKQSFP